MLSTMTSLISVAFLGSLVVFIAPGRIFAEPWVALIGCQNRDEYAWFLIGIRLVFRSLGSKSCLLSIGQSLLNRLGKQTSEKTAIVRVSPYRLLIEALVTRYSGPPLGDLDLVWTFVSFWGPAIPTETDGT